MDKYYVKLDTDGYLLSVSNIQNDGFVETPDLPEGGLTNAYRLTDSGWEYNPERAKSLMEQASEQSITLEDQVAALNAAVLEIANTVYGGGGE